MAPICLHALVKLKVCVECFQFLFKLIVANLIGFLEVSFLVDLVFVFFSVWGLAIIVIFFLS